MNSPSLKKICIVGAGAIGGFIGTKLAVATHEGVAAHEVSALARGDTLTALQQQGWRLNTAAGFVHAPLYKASENAVDLGVQDLIVIAVKSQSLADVAPTLAPMIGPRTLILPAMNGVPWWFMNNQQGFKNQPLHSIDPEGLIQRVLPVNQVVGCVVHASTSCPEPGLVNHKMGQGLIVGETFGGQSERVTAVVQALLNAGFDATQSSNVRYDIWYKLWGNLSTNPITAMTGATVDRVLADPLARQFCTLLMDEAKAVGQRIDCPIKQTPEDRHAITETLGVFKTSMLQDVEAGRSIELDAIVGVVHEIGRRVHVPTPNIDALFGLTRLFGQTKHLYKY